MEAVLRRVEEAGGTLNISKCAFNRRTLTFLGNVIDADGIRADPGKTEAIEEMHPPTTVSGVRRFLGMANQLGKFTSNLAELTQPLRELLGKSRAWTWGPAQSRDFKQVQEELMKPTVLALYDPAAPTKVSADTSSHGLGAVLLQSIDGSWRPVSYASRTSGNGLVPSESQVLCMVARPHQTADRFRPEMSRMCLYSQIQERAPIPNPTSTIPMATGSHSGLFSRYPEVIHL